jgi:hypothetical protein
MKWIFFLLVLANLALLAYTQLSGGASVEPKGAHQPLHAEQVQIIGLNQPKAPASQSAAARKNHIAQVPAVKLSCLEWASFSGAELLRVQQALGDLKLGDRLSQSPAEQAPSYWVYIPPLGTKQLGERKAAQLKNIGIKDYQLIQDAGQWRYAISMGVFSSAENADKYLAELRAKGVKSAKSGPRDLPLTVLTIKNADEALMAKLVALKQGFAGTELKAVECK